MGFEFRTFSDGPERAHALWGNTQLEAGLI